MNRHSSAIIGSLVVIVAYMLVRMCVYHFFPITSLESWFIRDTLMSIPRLGGLAALFLLNRNWKECRFELPRKDLGKAARLGFVPLALWVFYFSGGTGEKFTPFMMLGGFVTSLIVGGFEEYAFRGPLLSALRERRSVFASIILSSALFTISHIQAQRVTFWLAIFLAGVVFANLRVRGLGIGWLALIHGVIDASYFVFPPDNPGPFSFYGLVLQAGLLIYAIITFPWSAVTISRFSQSEGSN